jgi:uncharacterized protein
MHPLFLAPAPGATGGPRFALLHRPAGAVRGLVVFVHPFAEEMNKSRRMAAMQARALAGQGLAVLLPDLLGCGDSAGDFGEASWSAWVDDIVHASTWLRGQALGWAAAPDTAATADPPPLTLWGLRTGALLATEAAVRLGDVPRLLFWQPALNGKTVLQQFLRLQLASELMGGNAKGGTEALRARLAAGDSVDLAGYRLSPALAHGLEQARLELPRGVRQVDWLDVSPREDAVLAPGSAHTGARWREAGCQVHARVVTGPAFWQTTEIEDAPRLIEATLAALATPAPEAPPVAITA